MILSVVTTLYRSERHVSEFVRRMSAAASTLVGDDYEIVIVNDDSPDNALSLSVALAQQDPHIVVVDLSRNFGHHRALMTGLAHSRGDFVFLIDSDLEEDPASLLDFAAQMQNERCDVVYGVQAQRKGNWFERTSGAIFYSLYARVTGFLLPRNLLTLRLMTRRYVDALLQHEEREMFIAGLWLLTGFQQNPRVIKKLSTSNTTYSLGRKLALMTTAVTSMSNRPLIGVFYVGLGLSFLASAYILVLLIQWLFVDRIPDGWTSLIASIWLLGGFLLSSLGLVGIYLAKIFIEVKRRPASIIRAVYRKGFQPSPDFSILLAQCKLARHSSAANIDEE